MSKHCETKLGEPCCQNCGSGDLEPMHNPDGEFRADWCENCGSLNPRSGITIKPDREKDD